MKECKGCRVIKDLNSYHNDKKSKDGKSNVCKSCKRDYNQKRYSQNKDKIKAQSKEWYENNRERKIKSVKDNPNRFENKRKLQPTYAKKYLNWQRNNKQKINMYNLNRIENKKHNISKSEWENCKQYFNFECAYCGMNEIKHKEKFNQQLHKEHVIHDGANDLSNCVPACKSCNSSKREAALEEWYEQTNKQCSNFSQTRLDKITKWLNDDYERYFTNRFK